MRKQLQLALLSLYAVIFSVSFRFSSNSVLQKHVKIGKILSPLSASEQESEYWQGEWCVDMALRIFGEQLMFTSFS